MQATVVQSVQDAGDALGASLANALNQLISAIPDIIGAALILIIGWFIASLIGKGIAALLRAVNFNELAQRSGFAEFVHNLGVDKDSAGVLASVAKWFVRLIVLVAAFDVLQLTVVSNVLQQLLLWIPNLFVALVVLVIGGLAAKALGKLVKASTESAGLSNSGALATVARVAVWGFAIIVAVNQLGIAQALINTLLIGVVGALALASGLAFGLGGREKASEMLANWSIRAEGAAPKMAAAAEAGKQQAKQQAGGQNAKSGKQPWDGDDRREGWNPNYHGPERRLSYA